MNGQYRIGDTVMSNWTLMKKLGEGSFGRVYEIGRTDFGETYRAALKIITVPQNDAEIQAALEEGMSPEEAGQYFYSMVEDIVREFALMAKVKGTAHVVGYEDHQVVCHTQGLGWDILIRMELLTPLLAYAYAHPFTRRDIIKLGIDMCQSLELCQKYNIIHRDLKPENIFVSENGDFKLGDFGIARTVEKTMSGLSKKGTYNYMAPEVYKGVEYGFNVDIYSLGIVLYRLLNKNRVPFLPPAPQPIHYNDRERALARRMGGEALARPWYGNGRLGEIVLKAAAYDPKDRYFSPGQMRRELEAILYGEEDASVIYPEGDEVMLKENIYATMRRGRQEEGRISGGKEGGTLGWSHAKGTAGKGYAKEKDGKRDGQREAGRDPAGKDKAAFGGGSAEAAEETKERGAAAQGDEDKTVSVFGAGGASRGRRGTQRGKNKDAIQKEPSGNKKTDILAGAVVAAVVVAVGLLTGLLSNGALSTIANGSDGTQAGTRPTQTQEQPQETAAQAYEELKSKAESLYDSAPAEALACMEQALALYPDEPEAQTDYAYALYRIGDYDGCIVYGEQELALGKTFEPELQNQLNEILGAAYYEKADYAGAAAYFRMSAAGSEMSESAMRDYAVCLARLGSAAEAKDVLADLRRRGAGSDATRYVEGEAAYAAGEYAEAEGIFQELLEEADELAIRQRTFRSLAQLYRDCAVQERLGNTPLAEAGASIREAQLLLAGIDTYGLSFDSSLYEMLGQAAYEAYEKANELEMDLGQDYRLVAAEAFERVLALGARKDYIYSNLYRIHYELGDYEAAGEALTRMEGEFPASYIPHVLRGMLLITVENGKPEGERDYHAAQDAYNRAVELVGSADDTTYLQQLEGLMEQLKQGGWL